MKDDTAASRPELGDSARRAIAAGPKDGKALPARQGSHRPAESAVLPSNRLGTAVRVVVCILFAVATFPTLKPFPWGNGLERSWQMALPMSVARGLVYGRDFYFTYGPLGFISYPRDVGGLLDTAALWRVALYAVFWLSVAFNVWHCRSLFLACLLPLVVALSKVQDDISAVILFSQLAFLALSLQRGNFWPALPASILAALGLLVKFNLGVAGMISLFLWAAIRLAGQKRKTLALWLIPVTATFAVSFLGLYRAYGGPLDAISDFLIGSFRLASGYSAQMSVAGPIPTMYPAILGLALAAGAVAAGSYFDRRYAALALVLVGAVFVLFKSSFVRHDATHVILFMESFPALVALFLILPTTRVQEYGFAAVCLAVLAAALYGRPIIVASPDRTVAAARQNASPTEGRASPPGPGEVFLTSLVPDGPRNLPEAWNWSQTLRASRDEARVALARMRLPPSWLEHIGTTSIDAYPWEASYLFANRLNWSPRPVFQSYTAYTPELDEANARHYRSPDGPRFILYHMNSIDNQHPWFVDPLTLRECYRWYDVKEHVPDSVFALLERRTRARAGDLEETARETVRLGQQVTVAPAAASLVFAGLRFRLTPAGRLRELLWKVYPPSVELNFADGSTQKHRLVWRNAVSGVPISALPRGRHDLEALWEPAKRLAVNSFTLLADPQDFASEVEVTWMKFAEKSNSPQGAPGHTNPND